MSDEDLQRFVESFYPPVWLANHAEVTAMDIQLVHCLKAGQVYCTSPRRFAVKITDATSEEASVYDKLLRLDPASTNHVLPCAVVRSDTQHPFIIMPCLSDVVNSDIWRWNSMTFARNFRQMVEAIEMLHNQNIAHMDIAPNNFLIATEYHDDIPLHDCVELGKIYMIDFGVSQQFEIGPGRQSAVDLPPSQVQKPHGITRLDPFSWDIYCLGSTFQMLLRIPYKNRPQPWILRRYAAWLVGNEHGCTAVCRCRPNARQALLVLDLIVWILDAAGLKGAVEYAQNSSTLVSNSRVALRFSPPA